MVDHSELSDDFPGFRASAWNEPVREASFWSLFRFFIGGKASENQSIIPSKNSEGAN